MSYFPYSQQSCLENYVNNNLIIYNSNAYQVIIMRYIMFKRIRLWNTVVCKLVGTVKLEEPSYCDYCGILIQLKTIGCLYSYN